MMRTKITDRFAYQLHIGSLVKVYKGNDTAVGIVLGSRVDLGNLRVHVMWSDLEFTFSPESALVEL